MHRTSCTQGRKETVCLRMVCEIRMGAGADASVGGVVSGGEPPLPTLVCFFSCGVEGRLVRMEHTQG